MWDVLVQVLVVQGVHDGDINGLLQVCQIQDHARSRVRGSPDGHLERVVVPVAVGVVALAEKSYVLFVS